MGTPADWEVSGGGNADTNDSPAAAGDLTASALNAGSRTFTGLIFRREATDCNSYGLSLSDASNRIFSLTHRNFGNRRGQILPGVVLAAGVQSVTDADFDGSEFVQVHFRPSSAHVDSTLAVELVAKGECDSPTRPEPLTLSWAVTVQGPTAWETRSLDNLQPTVSFRATELAASNAAVDTGVAIQRSSAGCESTDVVLSNHKDKLELYQYTGDTRAVGSGAERIDAVSMPAAGGGDHVRVFFKAGVDVDAATLSVTMSAAANSSCTGPRRPSAASDISFLLTVTDRAVWEARTNDATAASGRFSRYDLLDSSSPTATGIQIHRSSSACTSTDVALAADTPSYLGLDLHGDSGVVLRSSHSGVAMPGSGAGDRHLRLYFAAGATVSNGTIVLTATLTANCAASDDLPEPQEIEYKLTVHTPGAHGWDVLDEDNQNPSSASFKWSVLEDGDLDTGVALHRNSADCERTDVELLNATAHLELRRYTTAGTAEGAGASRLTAVPMDPSVAATDRHVRLLFKAAYPPGPVITATVRVAPASSCTSRLNPAPETFMYVLNIDEDVDFPPTLNLSSARVAMRPSDGVTMAVGLTAIATDEDDADVVVAIDAVSARTFALRSAGANAHALWTRAGVTVEAGDLYTVVFTATDDAGSPPVSSRATAFIAVADSATEAAAVAAGAAAARAIGAAGIDAVLARPADGGDGAASLALLEMLAAKEAELESGEIDLREFLAGQSLALPLNQTGAGGGTKLGAWLQAAGGDVGGVAKGATAADDVYTDGKSFRLSFGADARFGALLAGLGYSVHETTADYGLEERRGMDAASEYELELGALQPYLAYDFGGTRLALAGGVGSGELLLKPAGEEARAHDVDYVGYALGLVQRLEAPGAGDAYLRGSYAGGKLDVAEPAGAAALDSNGSVLRLAAGYEHALAGGNGTVFTPSVEAGYLLLGGDGVDESSALLAGGLAYAGGPLDARAAYRHALADEVTLSGYELSFRLSPRTGGLGLGLEADPGYGLAGVEKMFEDLGAGRSLALADERAGGLRGGAGLSYGLAVAGGVLTPYGRWSVAAGRELGLRLRAGARHAWALGYGAEAQELKIEYRLGE